MFILRFLIVAVCAIMFLPMEPSGDLSNGPQANAENFCQRYPKTCGASGELWSVFKLKLAYGMKLARQELGFATRPNRLPHGGQKFGGRLNEWRPQDARRQHSGPQQLNPQYSDPRYSDPRYSGPQYSGMSSGTLSRSERMSDLQRDAR